MADPDPPIDKEPAVEDSQMSDAPESTPAVETTSLKDAQTHDMGQHASTLSNENPQNVQHEVDANPQPAAETTFPGVDQDQADAKPVDMIDNASPEQSNPHDVAEDALGSSEEMAIDLESPPSILSFQQGLFAQNVNRLDKLPTTGPPERSPKPAAEPEEEVIQRSTEPPKNLSAVDAARRDLEMALAEEETTEAMDIQTRVQLNRIIHDARQRLRKAEEEERVYNGDDVAVEDPDDDDSDDEDVTPAQVVPTPKRKRKSTAKTPNPKPAKKAKVHKPVKKPATAAQAWKKGAKNSTTGRPNLLNTNNMASNDIIENYNHTANLPDQPTFSITGTRNKKNRALAGIVESLGRFGTTDTTDVQHLDDAIGKFHGGALNVTPSGDCWLIKGMTTALKHYQVLGAGWMCEREQGDEVPRGGILADEMGLGKTLQMLACICNGKSRGGKGSPHSTLLVLPASLVKQWEAEIQKHTKERENRGYGIKSCFRYKASQHDKEYKKNIDKVLAQHDIVIVTYHEVGKSYPKINMPADLTTAESKDKFWNEEYKKLRGALHRVTWQRVVLDEAHTIKNHQGHFSRACRALLGEHRWAITGTPILNNISEFYPFFKFLKYPHTGSIRSFTNNYASADDPTGVERLNIVLRKIMIRRTQKDTMFGAKLLSLPKPSERTIWVKFNSVERACYEIVKRRFIARINAMSVSESLEKKYSHIWTMLLRLRQLCSHILAIQGTISDLLEREDWEAFKDLTDDRSVRDDECTAHLVQLYKMLESSRVLDHVTDKDETVLGATAKPPLVDVDEEIDPAIYGDLGGSHGQAYDFAKYISYASRSDGFKAMEDRTKCFACGETPKNPWVTACHHIYCGECLEQLGEKAARRGQELAKCLKCNQEFQESHPVNDAALDDLRASGKSGKGSALSQDDTADWIRDVKGEVLPSAKTLAIKVQIMHWLKEDPTTKIIIFTQFLPLIRIFQKVCQAEKWGCLEYTGKMSHESRDKTIQEFQNNPDAQILLASLRCGGIGLNLTMANRVICTDPYWNLSIENQAFARCFRIGQTKETMMTRFVVSDTVEDKIMDLKRRKQIEIDGVMENRKAFEKLGVGEVLRLFGNVEERNGRPFVVPEDYDDDDDHAADSGRYVGNSDEDDEETGFTNEA